MRLNSGRTTHVESGDTCYKWCHWQAVSSSSWLVNPCHTLAGNLADQLPDLGDFRLTRLQLDHLLVGLRLEILILVEATLGAVVMARGDGAKIAML